MKPGINLRRTDHAACALALGAALLLAPAVGAESEWSDESPPPLDFGLQTTAGPSSAAPCTWLRSTDGAHLLSEPWFTSCVDAAQIVSGGVATGMTTAVDQRLITGR